MTFEDKIDIRFDRLVDTQKKAIRLRNLLPSAHTEREELNQRIESIRDELLRLEESLDQDWIGNAAEIKQDISSSNGLLQKTINEIKDDLEDIAKVTKALGYIDKILGIAAALV